MHHQPEPIAEDYWGSFSEAHLRHGWCAVLLEPSMNPHQLMLFTKTLDELRSQVELEGLEP